MKALEILKDIEEGKWCGVKPTLSNYNLEDIKKAIKEFEDLISENKNLKAENQDLKNSNNELLEGLKSTQKRLEEWLEKCK